MVFTRFYSCSRFFELGCNLVECWRGMKEKILPSFTVKTLLKMVLDVYIQSSHSHHLSIRVMYSIKEKHIATYKHHMQVPVLYLSRLPNQVAELAFYYHKLASQWFVFYFLTDWGEKSIIPFVRVTSRTAPFYHSQLFPAFFSWRNYYCDVYEIKTLPIICLYAYLNIKNSFIPTLILQVGSDDWCSDGFHC